MNETTKTALISAVVAILAAAISAYTTIYLKKAELQTASKAAEETQERTGVLLEKVKATEVQFKSAAPTWVRARLEPGWSVYGEPYSDPAYAKDRFGFVHLRGLAKAGGRGKSNPLMFLPEGFRPGHQMEVVVACAEGVPCEAVIEKDGRVWFETWNPGWVSLDSLLFAAAP
jgi:hypothetical protein